MKSSFLPRSKIAWKCPDIKILCDFLCILQLFIYLSLGGQLVLSLGGPHPSLTLIEISFLLPCISLPKLSQKKGLWGVLGTAISLPSMGLSLSQAQVHQEGLRREGNRGLRRRNSEACDRVGEIANATFVGGPPGFSPCCRGGGLLLSASGSLKASPQGRVRDKMAASPMVALVTTGTGAVPEALLTDRAAGATQEERAGGLSSPPRDMAAVLVAMWVVSSALSRPGTGQGRLVG